MSKVVVRKNLNRWFKEKWVDVSRRDKDGKHPPCGRKKAKKGSKGYPKCRPSVKVSSKTPKTSGEMTSGQKRAATKRKRSKKQGVGGKPTIVKQDYPFEAVDTSAPDPVVDTFVSMHRKVPTKMRQFEAMERARKDPLTHPGFGAHDIFDTSLGQAQAVEPTIIGTNAPFTQPKPRPTIFGQQFQIADPEQMRRIYRIKDDTHKEGVHDGIVAAEELQMPRVQTQLVTPLDRNKLDPQGFYGDAMVNLPTFRGMPFNESTYFTTGEPMDLAFRLLKNDSEEAIRRQLGMMTALQDEAYKLAEMNMPYSREEYPSDEEYEDDLEQQGEYQLMQMMTSPHYDHLRERYKQSFPSMDNSGQFSDEFQDIHTGEPMNLAFRLLKRDMSHCNCNAPKGFSCRAHCKSKEKR